MDQPNSSSNFISDDNAEREKFLVDADVSVECGAPLPENYGDDRLIILPRDPNWFFAYWEITPERANQIRREHGSDIWENATLVMRVYDLSSTSDRTETASYFDVELNKQSRQWYVKVEKSGRFYIVDLGLRWPDGRFISILRSNCIQLPMGRVSDITDAEWMSVTGMIMTQEEWDRLLTVSVVGPGSSGHGSAEFAKSMAQRWEFLKSVFSASWFSSPPGGWPSSPSSSSWMTPIASGKEEKKS
ncbi:MAG: DUF4912 domain-containing protein [Elusimicrobiota bacterium]